MKKLSTKEMKKIAYEVISKELEKHNLKANIYPVSILEYYTKYIPNINFLDIKDFLNTIKYPFFNKYAIYDTLNASIIILINDFKKRNMPLFFFIFSCYHETIHSIQAFLNDYNYSKFLFNIESILSENNCKDYYDNHDNYSIEIGANLYGTFKTEELLKNEYPDIYKLEAQNIKNQENAYKIDYILYDAVDQINKVLNIVNKKKFKINDEMPIFNIFVRNDNSFKSIGDMLKNPEFERLDKRIIYTILSSDLFLKSINIQKLSNEELDTLNEALQYTYTIYNNQYKFIWEKFNNEEINFKFFIESAERLIKNIKEIDKYVLLLNTAKNSNQNQHNLKVNLKKY